MAVQPALPENAPSIGKGRYTLVARIGEGGMAGVYRAWDRKLRVWRAVKVLLPEFARRKKVRARFESEAHTMARLEHDNLVRIYDVGDAGELPFIVMELVSGGTLQGWTWRHGPMPPRLAIEVTLQVASGVLKAHAAGIVHRDIKPQNILISPSGNCKLTDFGIAHVDDEAMTRTGSVLGTLGYMAPEQRNDAKSVDQRADVYSIGATLWHLLTAEIAQDLFIASENPRMLKGIAEPLRPVICRCVAYDRADRYPDVNALVAALVAVLEQIPEVPDETPELVQDTTEEEVAVEHTDFGEIQGLLDAAGLRQAAAAAAAAASTMATPSMAPGSSSKAPLPYFMPQADRTKRRKPPSHLHVKSDSDAMPDWIDQDALSSTRRGPEQAVIGAGVPVSATPYQAPDRGGMQAIEAALRPERERERTLPPQSRMDPAPAPAPAPADAPPLTPTLHTSGAPEPVDDEPSIAQRLLALAAIPIGLSLVAATILVLGLALQFSWVANALQSAEREAVDSRTRLYTVIQDDRMIVDQLAAVGADRAILENTWLAFTETKGEPARTRAALTFLAAVEREAVRSNIDQGASLTEVEASHTLRRVRSARQAYDQSFAAWNEAANAPEGRLVILMGGASAPRD